MIYIADCHHVLKLFLGALGILCVGFGVVVRCINICV